ncbi:hypothetical protein Nepgr_010590 [Nepenthes gracilis]|uniref:Uncharacterized protein n=1 Tax=Nepenthes gracilis TaxID=150966 RepID=A0AAD3SCM9_NEPGR|nr:hypothetical protein Nepgr_010590 [Nepenthes gracilis]
METASGGNHESGIPLFPPHTRKKQKGSGLEQERAEVMEFLEDDDDFNQVQLKTRLTFRELMRKDQDQGEATEDLEDDFAKGDIVVDLSGRWLAITLFDKLKGYGQTEDPHPKPNTTNSKENTEVGGSFGPWLYASST